MPEIGIGTWLEEANAGEVEAEGPEGDEAEEEIAVVGDEEMRR